MGALVADAARTGDVIVAPATPPGRSALALLRLSGPSGRTLAIGRRIAAGFPVTPRPRHAYLSVLLDGDGLAVDEGLALFFPAPRSATGEEVVEVTCHGSPAIVGALMEGARRAGARPAGPGEFSRRALMNGRLSLDAAEGVALLASAESRAGAHRALGLARGLLSVRVRAVRERGLDLLAAIEGSLDFPDEISGGEGGGWETDALGLAQELGALAGELERGSSRNAVPVVAIAGRPNSGKSSLFNRLLGMDRAIVTSVPGTTRDALREVLEVGGESVLLIDTAGLRTAADELERLGMDAARRALDGADVVVGTSEPQDGEGIMELADVERARMIHVRTKCDLAVGGIGSEGFDVVTSAVTGAGIEELRLLIGRRLSARRPEGEFLSLERHREAVARAARSAEDAAALLSADEPAELVASVLRECLCALGEVTGETATEELLDRIFSSFCVGK